VGRRARDDVAAAVALLEHEHAAHSEARRRLTELTERNDQLREWNERVTTQLELSELELARTRGKLEASLRYVVAYEQAKLAGAELVRRLDNKEQQLEALKAQLLAVTQAAGVAAAAAAEPGDEDLSVSTEALLWSMSNLDVGERTIAELRSEIRRQSELEASASGATGSGRARSSAIVDHIAAQPAPAPASSAATSAAPASASTTAAADKSRVIPLEEVDKCSLCDSKFTLLRWKRRCPGCQAVCCSDCLPHTVTIRSGSEFKNARVCDNCFHRALERKVHQPAQ
jgi:hypothetical protein